MTKDHLLPKLRAAVRENRLGNLELVYRPREDIKGDFDNELRNYTQFIENILENLSDRNETLTEPIKQKYQGVEYYKIRTEVSLEDDSLSLGDDDSNDDDNEPSVTIQSHSYVEYPSGKIFGVDPQNDGPSFELGVRGNIFEEDSLAKAIDVKTGFIRIFGETVPEYIYGIGMDVNSADALGESLIIQCANAAHIKLLEWLLQAGGNANHQTNAGATALLKAVYNGSKDHEVVAQILLTKGKADVNLANRWGVTPLHMAVFRGNLDLCKLLLEHGASKDAKDCFGNEPGHYSHEDTCERDAEGNLSYNSEIEELFS